MRKHDHTRYLIILSTLTLLLIISACGGGSNNEPLTSQTSRACGVVELPTRALKVINGQSCGNLATAAIVRVAAVVQLGADVISIPICTGTMISANDVLTATHCLDTNDISGLLIKGYGIIYGEVDTAQFISATSVQVAPSLSIQDGRLVNDLAVLKLERSPNLNPLPVLLSSEPINGETGFVYGYGQKQTGTDLSFGDDFKSLEAGAMQIRSVSIEHISAKFDGSGTNVCNGDSGGPMIIEREDTAVIVGVVSQGSVAGCRAGDVTTFTKVSKPPLKDWLNQVAPEAAVL